MLRVDERSEKKRERELTSKRFYDTGRRRDITYGAFYVLRKLSPPPSPLLVPFNYVSPSSSACILNALSFYMHRAHISRSQIFSKRVFKFASLSRTLLRETLFSSTVVFYKLRNF